jgi:hypothetical protein
MASKTSESGEGIERVHFVVRHGGKLYVTAGAYVYDPRDPGLSDEEKSAIHYLNAKLQGRDVAYLEESDGTLSGHCIIVVSLP